MRYLEKPAVAPEGFAGLNYGRHAPAIRTRLVQVQRGLCAYSEKVFQTLDAVEVEHFDPRKKGTDADDFFNWYAVLRVLNLRKRRRIENFEPLPEPGTPELQSRIKYEDGEFRPVQENDMEVKRLIEFILANDELTYTQRANHLRSISELRETMTEEKLLDYLRRHPENLSFPTALETELGIPAFSLIEELRPQPSIP